ncbi:hypothetical protein C8F04DRAFT_1343158 [Mycena alexandri]|uniref:GATA-type domain-containing protein n=1 Tax=Mycena alexandri TaxID=1745969 RepID=A0AAD6XA81_9AGAR|nr:hypothetical protein C8F04DRAFT_1343158 [Mycena alexandri]
MKRKKSPGAAKGARRLRKRRREVSAHDADDSEGSFVDDGAELDGSTWTVRASRVIRPLPRRAHPPPGTVGGGSNLAAADVTELRLRAKQRVFGPRKNCNSPANLHEKSRHSRVTHCANCNAERNDGWYHSQILNASVCPPCYQHERRKFELRPLFLETRRAQAANPLGDVRCCCGSKRSSRGWIVSKLSGLRVCHTCYRYEKFPRKPTWGPLECGKCKLKSSSAGWHCRAGSDVHICHACYRKRCRRQTIQIPPGITTPRPESPAPASRVPSVRPSRMRPTGSSVVNPPPQINAHASSSRHRLDSPSRTVSSPSLAAAAAPPARDSRVPRTSRSRVHPREFAVVIPARQVNAHASSSRNTLDSDLAQAAHASSSRRTRPIRSTAPSPSRAGTPAFRALIPWARRLAEDEESDDELNCLP